MFSLKKIVLLIVQFKAVIIVACKISSQLSPIPQDIRLAYHHLIFYNCAINPI